MFDIQVSINGIILYCNDSILGLQIGRGYAIAKTYMDNLPFKAQIIDGKKQILTDYYHSVLRDEHGEYFICLNESDTYPTEDLLDIFRELTDANTAYKRKAKEYNHLEMKFLNRIFALLRVFKEGNIGPKEMFFSHSFSVGIIKNSVNSNNYLVDRNTLDTRLYTLNEYELQVCNQFLTDYSGPIFDIMETCIRKFIEAQSQIVFSTGFEKYITALEMMLLERNQQAKKEVLSKRVAVLLENSSESRASMYRKMRSFYQYRSESLHEGANQSITKKELFDLEQVVRKVLKLCMARCKDQISTISSITWNSVKQQMIHELKKEVEAAQAANIFAN